MKMSCNFRTFGMSRIMQEQMSSQTSVPTVVNQSNNGLKTYLDIIAEEIGLQILEYDVTTGSKVGDNYIGVIHRVSVTGKCHDNRMKILSLICKSLPESEARRKMFRSEVYFCNEAVFYNEVLTAYKRFQTEKHLETAQEFSSFPKCYHAGEVLLLEDMRPLGYEMRDRRVTLDVAHSRLVMRELGKLHALSFAMRDQKPEEFQRLRSKVIETLFLPVVGDTHRFTNYVQKAVAKFVESKEIITENKDMYVRKLEAFKDNYYARMLDAVDGDNLYGVITHGDCWTNNILFKYAKDSLAPQELCFLDFQMTRYASPVTDLSYFLYCCTSRDLRQEHYDGLIEEYHESLSSFLRVLGSDPEKLFPFAELQDQLRRFSRYALGMAVLVLPLLTCSADDVPDLNDFSNEDHKNAERNLIFDNSNEIGYSTRMNGVIADMVDKGFI